jgi:hypothetical protein
MTREFGALFSGKRAPQENSRSHLAEFIVLL